MQRSDFLKRERKLAAERSSNKQELKTALKVSRIPLHKLLEGPDPDKGYLKVKFPTGFRLQCLRGRSRAKAVKKTTLIEEYLTEKDPDDGEFYCKIRQYQGYKGPAYPFLEKRWMARLKTGMKLSVIHKMYSYNIRNLCLNYLGLIRFVFAEELCKNDPHMMRRVNTNTVKAKDREKLYTKLLRGEIFGEFNERERELIWNKLLSISTNRLIPSLFTFFEDLSYLEGPLKSMRRLVQPSPRETLNSALLRIYEGTSQEPSYVKIQESDSTIALVPGPEADRADLGIRQMWMLAMRDWVDIPPQRKKADSILRENPTYRESPKVLYELATLAFQSGFCSTSPEDTIARNALLKARPSEGFAYADFDSCKSLICSCFQTATEISTEDIISTAELDNVVKSPTRWGKPSATERKQTKPLLFTDRLHCKENLDEVTPYFVRKSVYLAFFEMPEFDHVNIGLRRRSRLGSGQVQGENGQIRNQEQIRAMERQLEDRRRELQEKQEKLEAEKGRKMKELKELRKRAEEENKRLNEEIKQKTKQAAEKQKQLQDQLNIKEGTR
ncbi:hypothetical protein QBC46DRAFT_367351 [Diplogelasinospora grovesii]|uniref:Uncharacterized protein n=1 Tax=Diplogelasinospora grovesii TaxID=303347 RepID=A0AAN6MYC1_9PEZI|nr:hypothetical protein QBC46DRAFT_367351 [Diplogelasinospora grovesii]